jgi:hypothetical protein
VSLHASCSISLQIPEEKAERWLKGTEWEGVKLSEVSDFDRARVAELLEGRIAEDFAHLLDYAHDDADVEVDW